MKNYTLYGLNKPGEEARYVGITSGPLKKRLRNHHNDLSNDYRGHWIAKAKSENVKIEIVPYCVGLSKDEACELERSVIAELRKVGLDLVNTHEGGNLPPVHFGNKHSLGFKHPFRRRRKHSPEQNAKKSLRLLGNKNGLGKNLGNKNSLGFKHPFRHRRKASQTTKEKMSVAQTLRRVKMSPEARASLSAVMILVWEKKRQEKILAEMWR